ncbi:MAG: hypothetical protein AAGD96_30430, partial [Chloroflexota bacterium]
MYKLKHIGRTFFAFTIAGFTLISTFLPTFIAESSILKSSMIRSSQVSDMLLCQSAPGQTFSSISLLYANQDTTFMEISDDFYSTSNGRDFVLGPDEMEWDRFEFLGEYKGRSYFLFIDDNFKRHLYSTIDGVMYNAGPSPTNGDWNQIKFLVSTENYVYFAFQDDQSFHDQLYVSTDGTKFSEIKPSILGDNINSIRLLQEDNGRAYFRVDDDTFSSWLYSTIDDSIPVLGPEYETGRWLSLVFMGQNGDDSYFSLESSDFTQNIYLTSDGAQYTEVSIPEPENSGAFSTFSFLGSASGWAYFEYVDDSFNSYLFSTTDGSSFTQGL